MERQSANDHGLPAPSTLIHEGIKHDVYRLGEGAPIILMHEITGMTPALIQLGHRIASSHFTVYLPHFFGPLGKRDEAAGFLFCLRREFNCFSKSKPYCRLAPRALPPRQQRVRRLICRIDRSVSVRERGSLDDDRDSGSCFGDVRTGAAVPAQGKSWGAGA